MYIHVEGLGAVWEVGSARSAREVTVRPKDSSRWQVADDLQKAVSEAWMTSGEASKTRGRAGWLSTNSYGRVGRIGTQALKQVQYDPAMSGKLTADQCRHLDWQDEGKQAAASA